MRGRVRLPAGLETLLVSDWERVIDETSLGQEDTEIARLSILERLPQQDIATELNMDRSTVSRRMTKILQNITTTASRLGLKAAHP